MIFWFCAFVIVRNVDYVSSLTGGFWQTLNTALDQLQTNSGAAVKTVFCIHLNGVELCGCRSEKKKHNLTPLVSLKCFEAEDIQVDV